MRRTALAMGLVVTPAAAAEVPLRCTYVKTWRSPSSAEVYISCKALNDGLRLDAISLNRGKCRVFDEDKGKLGSILNSGDRLEIGTGSCKLVEYSITINGKPMTFRRKWRGLECIKGDCGSF